MTKAKHILLSAVFILFFLSDGTAQTSFRFVPTMMMPAQFPATDVTPDFSVTVRNDTVDCYLPYIGVAYSAPMDNDGLQFVSEMKNVSIKTKKKKKETRTILEFTASKCNYERYRFTFTLFDNGKADLFLLPANSQNVSYTGDWEPLEKE